MAESIHPIFPEYSIHTDPDLLQLDVIHRYLSGESYWAKNIPLETVRKSVAHALCFGMYRGDEQVGFARVITDRATFAYLADVFILPGHQGKGLGKWLIETIHAYKDLQGLRRWMLATRDAHGLYEQFGWHIPEGEAAGRLMQKVYPDIYQPN